MKTYDLKLIQVLWVEDDQDAVERGQMDAYSFGLQLEAFPCWDDAKKALDEEYDRWSAIILDAKCKYHADSSDNAVRFLGEALKDISILGEKKGRIIPWYVFTGGDEGEVSDSINDDRMKWDGDWTEGKKKKYYSKNTDDEDLYRRIRYHAQKSHRLQIQEMYRNVFEAIEECKIDDNGYNAMEELLLPIHFPETIAEKDYNTKFEKAREVLEYLFRSMSFYGILPEWGKQVNLTWSSCLLCGRPATRKGMDGKDHVVIESKKHVLPNVLEKVMKEMVNIIPAYCHSDSGEKAIINKEEYFNHVDCSTYLLKSFTFQLCDIILWYKNYLRENRNAEHNISGWEVIESGYFK